MKFYTLWHSELGFGTSATNKLPVLHHHKADVTRATGVTLRKLRELGWRWIVVDITTPVPTTKLERLEEVHQLLQELTEERAELMADFVLPQTTPDIPMPSVKPTMGPRPPRPPGAAGDASE